MATSDGAELGERGLLTGRGALAGPKPDAVKVRHHVADDDWPTYLKNALYALVIDSKLNLLLVCMPIAAFSTNKSVSFTGALLALCPLAERLGFVTEQLALHTNATIGGLLNATFGNATEMIVCIFAIRRGLLRVVQLSLLGSVLSNLLLVLGTAFLLGGLRYKVQTFSVDSVKANTSLLMLGMITLLMPNLLDTTNSMLDNRDSLRLSRFCSVVLLIVYAAFLVFQLKTHRYLFEGEDEPPAVDSAAASTVDSEDTAWNCARARMQQRQPPVQPQPPPPQQPLQPFSPLPPCFSSAEERGGEGSGAQTPARSEAAEAPTAGGDEDADEDDDEEDEVLGLQGSIFWLAFLTFWVAWLSEIIVDTIEGAAKSMKLPVAFVSTILLPIVGNAAEHAAAVIFAMKNKMELSIGVAVGSATQITLFVIPFCVAVAGVVDAPLSLDFAPFETGVFVFSVLGATMVMSDGRSHWLKGLVLVAAYVVLAAAFFFHVDPPGINGATWVNKDNLTKTQFPLAKPYAKMAG